MQKTNIEWATHSANPLRARNRETGAVGHFCIKDGPECTHCYAEAWNLRLGTGLPFNPSSLPLLELFLEEKELQKVLGHRGPARLFWADMTDLAGGFCGEALPGWLDRIMEVVRRKDAITHMLLTKRPGNLGGYFAGRGLPLPGNLWVGATAGLQSRAEEKLPPLVAIPAAVRFVSVEPLLGPLDLSPWLDRLDWVVVGAESGSGARPLLVEWVRAIVRQCQDAGVAVFVKQLGKRPEAEQPDGGRLALHLRDHKGGDPAEWPEDLRVREYPPSG
jgi:protein gp37